MCNISKYSVSIFLMFLGKLSVTVVGFLFSCLLPLEVYGVVTTFFTY